MTYPPLWPCQIIDKSLSGHCHLKNTCAKDLKVRPLHRENTWNTANGLADDASPPRCRGRSVQVLNKGNGIDLGHCPNQLRRDFFEAYKDDPQMKAVRESLHCQLPSCRGETAHAVPAAGAAARTGGRLPVPPRVRAVRGVHALQQVAHRHRQHAVSTRRPLPPFTRSRSSTSSLTPLLPPPGCLPAGTRSGGTRRLAGPYGTRTSRRSPPTLATWWQRTTSTTPSTSSEPPPHPTQP